jgi:hypothetical protein
LGHAEFGSIDHGGLDVVAKPLQTGQDTAPVFSKRRRGERRDVFKHDGARKNLAHYSDRFREEISVVAVTSLVARNREWLTGYTSRN